MYLCARESVSFPQSIHLELNTLTLNSALLIDTLISFYQHILVFDMNHLLKVLCCSACNVDMLKRNDCMLLKRGGCVLLAVE